MRKGAAGYVRCILSSAIRVTSTFADVAYSKPPRNRGLFSFVVVDNLPQKNQESKTKYANRAQDGTTSSAMWKTCGKLLYKETLHFLAISVCFVYNVIIKNRGGRHENFFA